MNNSSKWKISWHYSSRDTSSPVMMPPMATALLLTSFQHDISALFSLTGLFQGERSLQQISVIEMNDSEWRLLACENGNSCLQNTSFSKSELESNHRPFGHAYDTDYKIRKKDLPFFTRWGEKSCIKPYRWISRRKSWTILTIIVQG